MKYFNQGGLDAWDRDLYMNVWTCPLLGGLLGFAVFPGTTEKGVDGIVVGSETVGSMLSPGFS